MSYQPFLISNFATGFDREVQPWLLPTDAFFDLEDGFVYRGVTQKRDGYQGFARGLKSTYTESRMIHTLAAQAMTGAIDGVNTTFTFAATPPVSRGSVTVNGSNPVQTFTDNGFGFFLFTTINISAVTLTNPAGITTAVNHGYTTGDQVIISNVGGTTQLNIITAYTITVTGLNTFTLDGIDATAFTPFTAGGTVQKVAGTVNYTTGAISVTFATAPVALSTVTITVSSFPGNPVMGIMNYYPTNNVRQLIVADTQFVNRYDPTTDRLVDISPAAPYNGTASDFWSWVNYEASDSAPRLLFANGVVGDVIQVYNGTTVTAYAPTFPAGITSLNARQLFNARDRLILFDTIENNVRFPRRIRISGTGTNCDKFDIGTPGAGFIDIPDNTHFFGAAFNRDDLLFFTEAATWMLKYTGNDVTPFTLEKIDGSRGSLAAFSVISYLNRTLAASPRGLIISDGYQVDRMDNNIPNFSFDDIDADNFTKCFSGFLDEERDVYLIHPSAGIVKPSSVPAGSSDRILTINFEEDNFAIYNIPLSCMGNFQVAFTFLWSDLTAANGFPNWDTLAEKFGNWNAFPFDKGTPISIGGGHKGEIWRLNVSESEDNPQPVRAISILDSTHLRVTSDWNNYSKGDYIVFEALGGMTQANDKQAAISNVISNTQFDVEILTGGFSAYTSGGTVSKTIPFKCTTKKLNPWIDADKKVLCGWIYFYVSVAETDLTDRLGVPVPAQLRVDVLTNNNEGTDFSNPTFTYLVDCTDPVLELGTKKWVKIWINQVGQFLQLQFSNNQSGAQIKIHAIMPGFRPLGRLV